MTHDPPGPVCKATYRGRTYQIPDIWIAGFCQGAKLRGEPHEIGDAIAYWAQQVAYAELEEADEREASHGR